MLFSIQRYFWNISKAGNVLRRLQNDVYRRNMIILTVKIRIRRLSVVPSKVLLRLEEVYSRGKATMSKSGLHWEPSGPPLVNVREGPEGWKGGGLWWEGSSPEGPTGTGADRNATAAARQVLYIKGFSIFTNNRGRLTAEASARGAEKRGRRIVSTLSLSTFYLLKEKL